VCVCVWWLLPSARGSIAAVVAVQDRGWWPMSHSGPPPTRPSPAQPRISSPASPSRCGTFSAGCHKHPFRWALSAPMPSCAGCRSHQTLPVVFLSVVLPPLKKSQNQNIYLFLLSSLHLGFRGSPSSPAEFWP